MNMISTSPGAFWTIHWTRLARRLRWVTHPITVFVSLQIVWLAITLIWVIWFVGEQAAISQLAKRFGREYFDSGTALAILIVGCVLLGVLLVGTILLFVFGQRQSMAARQQRSFVSSVTHELKSPLASLQLGFETLSMHKLPEDAQNRVMEMIQSDIERLRRLVDQILVAGRLDRGARIFDEEVQTFNVEDLIQRIAERLSYLDSRLRERLTIECPAGLNLHTSKSALQLILNNLLENAVKYSPRATPIIVSVDQVGSEVFLYVRDQGMGLDRKDQRRIFRMFHRSDVAVKKAIPGTGLGLYIVRSIVSSLGGRAWVESLGRGLGSTFYVSLPVPKAVPSQESSHDGRS
jgi:signal transduction histidine kinase